MIECCDYKDIDTSSSGRNHANIYLSQSEYSINIYRYVYSYKLILLYGSIEDTIGDHGS